MHTIFLDALAASDAAPSCLKGEDMLHTIDRSSLTAEFGRSIKNVRVL